MIPFKSSLCASMAFIWSTNVAILGLSIQRPLMRRDTKAWVMGMFSGA